MKFAALTFALVIATAAAADGQTIESVGWPPTPGLKARVLSPTFGAEKQIGVIESARGDTLQFRHSASVTTLTPANITSLDVLTGTHTEKGKWTIIGFVGGAIAGAGIGALTYKKKDRCGDFGCYRVGSKSVDAGAGALLGLVGGSIIGALYGSRTRNEWTSIPVPAR